MKQKLLAAFGLLKLIEELVNDFQKADHEIISDIRALLKYSEADE